MVLIPGGNPVVIQTRKSLGGRQYSNTWYFHCPSAVSAESRVILARDTILARLHDFERRLSVDEVAFLHSYIGDATEQPPPTEGGTASYYTRVTHGDQGLEATSGDATAILAALNVAMRIRMDTGLLRPGYKYFRGQLTEGDISPGGPQGVQLTNPAAIGALTTKIVNAASASLLATHFEGGTNAGVAVLAVPKYIISPGSVRRTLLSMNTVSALACDGISDRSIRRRWFNRRGNAEV